MCSNHDNHDQPAIRDGSASVRDLDYQIVAEQELLRALLQAILLGSFTPRSTPVTIAELQSQVMDFVAANGPHSGVDNKRLNAIAAERVADLFAAVNAAYAAMNPAGPAPVVTH